MGDWVLDSKKLKLEAVKFFEKLYGENPGPMKGLPLNAFSLLDRGDVTLLNKLVMDEESASVYNWVKGVFEGETIDSDLNNSLIVLILKVQNLEDFS
ncbi:hypothetical protein PVK06_035953 [Gossypium arboreum]|uniref:Uncharacterized protein n=1 Tax=Gossypium arboreum TaxID=29729 RepID=A0ABR0NI65_GOSAR|nr:hypothetical protein PVK06_035953 [Gossypium arboreum]